MLPLVLGSHAPTPIVLVVGASAQLVCAGTGTAVGVACSRLVIPRPGHALFAALALVLILLLAPGAPPVNTLVSALSRAHRPVELVWPVFGSGSLAVVLVLASAVLAQRFSARER